MENGHFVVAIIRKVKTGKEPLFEQALGQFYLDAINTGSTKGQFFVRPAEKDDNRYGMLRSFNSRSEMDDFYQSDVFKSWEKTVAPLVEGQAVKRELHGLEAFFDRGSVSTPPRWKMAVVTWLGVFPSVLLWSNVLTHILPGVPYLAVMAVVNVLVVATLTWVVMPFLTRLFGAWLRRR